MAKRHNNLFDKIVDFENLLNAYKSARKGKRYAQSVLDYTENLETNLHKLRESLINGTYVPKPTTKFTLREPKVREIEAPHFSDRIVHHAIYNVVNSLFEKRFIHHSYACRTGKGNIAAVKNIQKDLKRLLGKYPDAYVVKADISKYFKNIAHEILFKRIAKVIKCIKTLNLWKLVVGNGKVGINVGALTSQLAANIYLDYLDHVMTDQHGYRYYRYMDDFIIFAKDKASSIEALAKVKEALTSLRLELNPKTTVLRADSGLDFCGYVIFKTHITPRKRIIKRWKSRFNHSKNQYRQWFTNATKCRELLMSFLAYVKHCSARHPTKLILRNYLLVRNHTRILA